MTAHSLPTTTHPDRCLRLNLIRAGVVVSVAIDGNLDVYTAHRLGELVRRVDLTRGTLVVDLLGIDHVDSAGLAALRTLGRRARRGGRVPRLTCAAELGEMLALTDLSDLFALDRPAALSAA